MKRFQRYFPAATIVGWGFSLVSCQQTADVRVGEFSHRISFEVGNTLDRAREEVFVHLDESLLKDAAKDFNPQGFAVRVGGEEIPAQYNKTGQDKGVVFVLPSMDAHETQDVELVYHHENDILREYPKRTQAELSHKEGGRFENRKYIGGEFRNVTELRVPAEHTDHSYFIRYEGPGWESDKVAYRFYLDWRNGVDVFGKKTPEPVLQLVGQDGFDSYHEMQDWGMDVLKVGKTLGVGSIATFVDGKARRVDLTDSIYAAITENGPVYSSILTEYHGWDLKEGKTTLTSNLSIHAGSRLSKQSLRSSEEIGNLATGLIIDPKAELILGGEASRFGYMATYGPQSLAGDNLGIAVIFNNSQKLQVTQDGLSHVVVMSPLERALDYYFLAAWEQETEGIRNKEDFVAYLDRVIEELSHPVKVSLK